MAGASDLPDEKRRSASFLVGLFFSRRMFHAFFGWGHPNRRTHCKMSNRRTDSMIGGHRLLSTLSGAVRQFPFQIHQAHLLSITLRSTNHLQLLGCERRSVPTSVDIVR
jgi:hypothetical protein